MSEHQHSWRFNGDDPYVLCDCGERVRVIVPMPVTPSPPPWAQDVETVRAALLPVRSDDPLTGRYSDAVTALDRLAAELEDRYMRNAKALQRIADAERIEELEAELERVTRERDEYLTANNSARVCAAHIEEFAGDGDCLVCLAERAEAEVERLRAELEALKGEEQSVVGKHIAYRFITYKVLNQRIDAALVRAALRKEAGE